MNNLRFLLDANLSPETAEYLRSLHYEVKSLIEDHQGDLPDEAVAEIARKEKLVVITFDLDFGEIYYFSTEKAFHVILLRLNDQRVEAVNQILQRFLVSFGHELLRKLHKLFIIDESSVRIAE